MRDEKGRVLTKGGVWLLELEKFHATTIQSEDQRWLQFFKEGEQLDDAVLPEWMTTNEMRQAMTTLSVFSEKERAYFQYQARQEYLRVQATIQQSYENALKEKREAEKKQQEAEQRERAALQEKEAALLEIERLKALLNK